MLPQRLTDKISINTAGCWIWTAVRNNKGYGMTTTGSKRDGTRKGVLAHRLIYQLSIGEIPVGKELDHLCHTPACVNPDHLEPKTHAGNMQNSKAALKK